MIEQITRSNGIFLPIYKSHNGLKLARDIDRICPQLHMEESKIKFMEGEERYF